MRLPLRTTRRSGLPCFHRSAELGQALTLVAGSCRRGRCIHRGGRSGSIDGRWPGEATSTPCPLRTYSWWEAMAGSAVGAGASGPAAAAVGTAVAIGAGHVASKSQRKNAQVVAALRAGLRLRPEAGSQALPQNIGGLTWKSLLGLPGCGVVALLATMGLAAAIAFHDSEVRHAVPYRAAPMCQSPTQTSCIGTKPATVLAQGSGRHSDGSPGSRTWLLLRLSDGSQTYVDLYDPVAGGVSVGEAVSVDVWYGAVTDVDARGRAAANFRNPGARAA